MKLYELLSGVEIAQGAKVSLDTSVCGVKSDSRRVEKGDAFVCLKGIRCNGENYIKDAVNNGASVIICDKACSACVKGAEFIRVNNTRSAYSHMLSNLYGGPSDGMRMIGVTGTNGKTTVCKMIASALAESGRRVALIGTLGAAFEGEEYSLGTMTTPDPEVLYSLLRHFKDRGAEDVVMEASSHALELGKLDPIRFSVGAITNITAEHLDFHGNIDSYRRAKARLFAMSERGVFLCDGIHTSELYNGMPKEKRLSCSVNDSTRDIYAESISCSFENGTSFTVRHGESAYAMYSPMPTYFTVSNALLAYSVLFALGVEYPSIYRGIASLEGVDGRMERVETNEDFSVYIDFAHTPDALSGLLTAVRKMKNSGGRILTLFGCGGDRDRSKRSLMGMVASALSDMVIVTSDNSRSEDPSEIIDEIMLGFDKSCPHVRIDDRRKAIEYAIVNAEKGDMILLCGKGHENYEIDKMGAHSFSEREIVMEALKQRRKMKNAQPL